MYLHKSLIFVTILLLSLITLGQQQDGSVFERRVTIQQENQLLEHILEQISWQAGVYFSYDAMVVNPAQEISVDIENKSLYHVLNDLFDPEEYVLRERENQVIIAEKVDDHNTLADLDTIPVKYFFLRGKLIEERREKAVPYASVSVLQKPVGTISNTDGEFLLKLHPNDIRDTVVISCMGYRQIRMPAFQLLDNDIFMLHPVSIRIKEVRVTSTTPDNLLRNIRNNLDKNYSTDNRLMSAFYRETVQQDGQYINVSEAVIEVLKSPYNSGVRSDLVRLVKGRKNPDVQPFQWLNFKLQGGPFTIIKLDLVKTNESFINELDRGSYRYEIERVIWFKNEPVYVVSFSPVSDKVFPGFIGEMYVHRETFAIVHANYRFNRSSLKQATGIMIKKKPLGVKARPTSVEYSVNYQFYNGKWHLSTAQAAVNFKIRSKRDKLNAEFYSISDLLITDIKPTELKRFPYKERFTQNDVFVENLGYYDEKFWENYNIIKPNEDLRNAFKKNK